MKNVRIRRINIKQEQIKINDEFISSLVEEGQPVILENTEGLDMTENWTVDGLCEKMKDCNLSIHKGGNLTLDFRTKVIFSLKFFVIFFRISNTQINILLPIFSEKSLPEKSAIFALLAPDARIFPISKRIIQLFHPISIFSSQNERTHKFCAFRQKISKSGFITTRSTIFWRKLLAKKKCCFLTRMMPEICTSTGTNQSVSAWFRIWKRIWRSFRIFSKQGRLEKSSNLEMFYLFQRSGFTVQKLL